MASHEERAIALVHHIQQGNTSELERLIGDLTSAQNPEWFDEFGHLSRKLHDALRGFELDSRLAGIAEHELPDAKARLDYVVSKTEQSAHTTLDAVERIAPLSEGLGKRAADIKSHWLSGHRHHASFGEDSLLLQAVRDFVESVEGDAGRIGSGLNQVLVAQEFQDLTGQVLRRVIALVEEVQTNLVQILQIREGTRNAGSQLLDSDSSKGVGPQVSPSADVVSSQDDVDDLLASLGF